MVLDEPPAPLRDTWGLLALLEDFRAFKLGYVFESGFHEFAGFLQIPFGFGDVLVVMNVDQVCVDQGVFDVFVPRMFITWRMSLVRWYSIVASSGVAF